MPRHYSADEKQLVLDRLVANRGDITRTAKETGVSDRTLLRWRQEHNIPPPSVHVMSSPPTTTSPTQNASPSLYTERGPGGEVPLNPEILDSLYELRDKMLFIINTLIDAIGPAIQDAPLNQLTTALAQITDRYIKLGHELPPEDEEIEMEHPIAKVKDDDVEEEDSTPDSPSQAGEDY
ncbi:MAG: hypothetical protein R3E39_28155 [Anaerolineae bacterium]